MYKCELPIDINNCPHFNRESGMCNNPNKCNLQERNAENTNGYVRKERWYEQYYRKK